MSSGLPVIAMKNEFPAAAAAGHVATANRIEAVQGLRGIAVLAVLLFHVELPVIHGGYLGVDIFFVISGFVITLLLQRRIESGQFSFVDFYVRRAWRLLPALVVSLVATAVLFFALTPEAINPTLLPSLLSATVGLSNIYFASSVDYFASGISNPVLHTWSLGVEEQFYLVFPWLMVLVGWKPRLQGILLPALALLSFAAAVVMTQVNQSAAFYFPWLRGWEFLAGALVASYPRERIGGRLAGGLSVVGFATILVCIVFYKETYLFPGLGALAPVLGASMILAASSHGNVVNRLLSSSPVRRLGDMSYSIYLAHWPAVCLVGMFFPLDRLTHQLMALLASLVAGYGLWRWVEMPTLARYNPAPRPYRWAVVPAVFATTMSLVVGASFGSKVLWNAHPEAVNYLQPLVEDKEIFREGECFLSFKAPFDKFKPDPCLKTTPGRSAVLILGDSMAANIALALQKEWPARDVLQATAVEYRLVNEGGWPEFTKSLDKLVWSDEYLGARGRIDTVVLFARWHKEDLIALPVLIDKLRARGAKVVVLGPSPEFYVSLPLILAYSNVIDVDLVDWMNKHERQQLDSSFAELLSGRAEYISTMAVICPAGKCQASEHGKSLFLDRVHFSKLGVELFIPKLLAGRSL